MFDTEYKDVKIIGMWTHGPGLIHSKNPIKSIEDLKGVKVRAPSRVTNMMVTSLGATAVGMPVPAVPEALSKGVIDATILPWEVTASIKSSELVKNHTEFPGAPLYTAAFVLAMNKGVYDKLPDDLKAVIDANSGADFSANAGKVSQDADAAARKIATDLGNNIIELSQAEIETWKAAAQPTIDAWVKEMDAAGIDGKALLAEAQAAIAANTEVAWGASGPPSPGGPEDLHDGKIHQEACAHMRLCRRDHSCRTGPHDLHQHCGAGICLCRTWPGEGRLRIA